MIWEFKCHCIVQLCQNEEEGQKKCYMYWPTMEGEMCSYGAIHVTLQSESKMSGGDFIVRKFQVKVSISVYNDSYNFSIV